MPEIALTAQFLDRFAARFGVRPAEWHSQLSPRKRARTWAAVAAGEVPVVVGARSALFLPYADLGLIVVDEEHDPAYKQEDGVHYHARDMAVVRGAIAKIPVVLASATPSVEIGSQRAARPLPRICICRSASAARICRRSRRSICGAKARRAAASFRRRSPKRCSDTLERGEQALLFLNRRGYAPLTLCRACGFRLHCPNCDAWLVDHRFQRRLVCHHCGFAMPPPDECPNCHATDSFAAVGPGVERLEQEAAELFPRRAHPGAVERSRRIDRAAARRNSTTSREGRFDIIIGTQLVAKGHHFPKLNLVGIVDADLGLGNGDPRAAERTFQLLHQVVGRAGREEGRGLGFCRRISPSIR